HTRWPRDWSSDVCSSDLYALGCLLHEMLMGAPPFVADTTEAVLAAHRDIEPKEPSVELPAAARTLLASLLAKEPRRRPFSAQQRSEERRVGKECRWRGWG